MDKKIVYSMILISLMATVSVAYNSSLVDAKRNWTADDVSKALPDVIVQTSQQTSANALGQMVAKYLVYLLFAVVVGYLIKLASVRGWI